MTVIVGSNSKDFNVYVKRLLESEIVVSLDCPYEKILEFAKKYPSAKIIVDIHANGSMSECLGCNILKDLRELNYDNPVLLLGWMTRKYILRDTSNTTTQNNWLYNTFINSYRICQLPISSTELKQIIDELIPFHYE